MSAVKIIKNQNVSDNKLMNKYAEVMKNVPVIIRVDHNLSNLRQPSLLEEVDSVTTYEVSATAQEWK